MDSIGGGRMGRDDRGGGQRRILLTGTTWVPLLARAFKVTHMSARVAYGFCFVLR